MNEAMIGQRDTGTVLCDGCGRRIAVTGIHPETIERGEIQITAFRCGWCGRAYPILTTDSALRRLLRRRTRIWEQIKKVRSRQDTGRIERREEILKRRIEERAAELEAVGEAIFSGKDGEDHHGQEDRDRGSESVPTDR